MNSSELANDICKRIFKLEEKSSMSNSYYPLIDNKNKQSIIDIVTTTINEHTIDRVAELEAKVFVYEEMIKKSNFAPMVKSSDDDVIQRKLNELMKKTMEKK